jgi:hypothetical protein
VCGYVYMVFFSCLCMLMMMRGWSPPLLPHTHEDPNTTTTKTQTATKTQATFLRLMSRCLCGRRGSVVGCVCVCVCVCLCDWARVWGGVDGVCVWWREEGRRCHSVCCPCRNNHHHHHHSLLLHYIMLVCVYLSMYMYVSMCL